MKNFLFFLAVLLLICFACGVFGAPAPFQRPKIQEPTSGKYTMQFGDWAIPDECILYKNGGYSLKYTTRQGSLQWCPGMDAPLETFTVSTEICLGQWKWDKINRVLTLRESRAGDDNVDRTFRFQFKSDSLETENNPVDFEKIFLRMRRK